MSSHHIVRDKQEPALLIMDLNGFDHENLGQLLEWSPTVLVNEPLYEAVDSMGIKIDGIISKDMASSLQLKTFVIHTEDTPLQDALKYLAGEQYPSVNVITTTFRLKDYALFAERINLVVLTPGKRIFGIKPGFSKWQRAGEKIGILSEVKHLGTQGLIKLDDHSYQTGKEGFYSLSFDQPFIFISEEL